MESSIINCLAGWIYLTEALTFLAVVGSGLTALFMYRSYRHSKETSKDDLIISTREISPKIHIDEKSYSYRKKKISFKIKNVSLHPIRQIRIYNGVGFSTENYYTKEVFLKYGENILVEFECEITGDGQPFGICATGFNDEEYFVTGAFKQNTIEPNYQQSGLA